MAAAIHAGPILAAAFGATPDHVYSASLDGDVVLRGATNAAVLARWRCHDGPVTDLYYDAARKHLVSCGHDGCIRLWHPTSGAARGELCGHSAGIFGIAIRGNTLASASFDRTIRVWDAASGVWLQTLSGHDDAVTDVEFVADDVIASSSRDRTIRLWHWPSATPIAALSGHDLWVTRVAVLRDGMELLSASEDGSLRRWDCATGETLDVRHAPHRAPIWGLAVDRTGHHAIVGAAGSTTLWHFDPAMPAASTAILDATSRAIAFDDAGDTAILGNDASDVVVYDLARRVQRTLYGGSPRILSLAVDPTHSTCAVGTATGVMVQHNGRWRHCDTHRAFTYAIATLDRGRFAEGAFDGRIVVRDFDGTEGRALNHRGLVFSLAYAPGVRRLVSAGSDRVVLWDLESGASCWLRESIGSGVHTMADATADATRIVSVGEDAVLRIFDVDGDTVRLIPLPTDLCCAIALLNDGATAIVGTAYGELLHVELASACVRRLHAEHEDWIRSLCVTPDGRYAISASQQGVCRAYDLVEDRVVRLHEPVAAVAVLDPRTALLALCDGQLRRVDVSARTDSAPTVS